MAVAPDIQEFEQLAVYGLSIDENWQKVDSVLRMLETGNFQLPSRLADQMLRDDRVFGVLTTRLNGVLGSPIEFAPADESAKAQQIADEIEEQWDYIFPHSQVKEVMQAGIMLGLGFGALEWERTEKRWTPQLRAWHCQNARYQWADNTYRTITANAGEQIIEQGSGTWFLYTPFGYSWSYLRGAMRPLAKPWLARTLTALSWSRLDEVHGLPVRVVEVPASADEKAQKRVLKEVSRMNAEATIRLPKMEDGTSYNVKLLEATSTSYEGFEKHINEVNRQIAIVLLGQALSTEGSKGLGSHDKAGEDVRLDIKQADALIADDFRSQVLELYCEYNYGNRDLAPKVRYVVEPPEDNAQKATALKTFADALISFRTTGVNVDVAQLLHEYGVPMMEGQPPVLEPEPESKPANLQDEQDGEEETDQEA